MKRFLRQTAILCILALCIPLFGVSAIDIEYPPLAPDIVSGNVYYIRNKWSGLYLDVERASHADGARVLQHHLTDGDNQKWTIERLSNGNYIIRPVHSPTMALMGTYLEPMENGGRVTISGVLSNDPEIVLPAMQWRFDKTEDGGFIISTMSSNYSRCLVTENASQDSGAYVVQYQYEDNGDTNDIWVLEPLGAQTGMVNDFWQYNIQSTNPVGEAEHLFVPYKGEMWLNFYNNPKVVKSTIGVKFNYQNIQELKNQVDPEYEGSYFGIDVTSHSSGGNSNKSSLSAYTVVTNLPNPKIDIENDRWHPGDRDFRFEESEVVCQSPDRLVVDRDYFMITYWHDYRRGDIKDAGYVTTTFELDDLYGGEYIYKIQSDKTHTLDYGKQGGYQ